MLRDYDKFYSLSLKVLDQLLETGNVTELQYWNAIRALPLIFRHRSQLGSESELIFLFSFGSITDKYIASYEQVEKVLSNYGFEESEIFITVRDAMNIPKIDEKRIDFSEKRKIYKARMRRYRRSLRTIRKLLDQICDEELKKKIDIEVDNFAYQFTALNLRPLKDYFLVYLEKLARKYHSRVTKDFIRKEFVVDTSGWMKMMKNLKDSGIRIDFDRNPSKFVLPARKILGEMYEYEILSEGLLQSTSEILDDIPTKYQNFMRGDQKEFLIAFASIQLVSKRELVDITELFVQYDVVADRINGKSRDERKTFYYQTFYRALQRQELFTQRIQK